ncbi:phosphoribosylamine--glycine ligase [Zhaonella formicivorans]|jgi:phosphoribosylamine--glycine ligase|uniref:phosphoribosylamine--glycine ligase n=1 Tax=Zhaonella formicivorans TaxID=2528593 RepID=UPI0010EC3888|nr:phosphoribosylamine--glycine ligase [Zhaonella formicivorans]
MKILVVGGGGREHALVWKLAQSPKVTNIYCAPGNGGICQTAKCVPIAAENIEGLVRFALEQKIDLTVVGPEAPLVLGIAELFQAHGLRIFAPTGRAAAIEGSKGLAKDLMYKYHIPTARYGVFEEPEMAKLYIRDNGVPCVVKADGLAAGKGVIVAMTMEEACRAVDSFMNELSLGVAGSKVVIEEFLVGEEVSVMAFTDGKTVKPMVWAQDHKRVYDGDQGPNTGGMGAYSPPKMYTPELDKQITETILQPVIEGLTWENRFYQGVIYAGLMLTAGGPKVLEFNARFGDPETQAVLMRLETDLVDIIEAILEGRLAETSVTWRDEAAACVVLASGGYPGSYRKGLSITGLESIQDPDVQIFHAGTAIKDGQVVTSGGRVLGVTALGADVREALSKAYRAVEKINFPDMHYRKDIGYRAL